MIDALKAAGDRFETSNVTSSEPLDQNAVRGSNTESEPNFTISEFARLIIVMRDDERARSALYRLGQELRRAELDCGTSRDSFWGIIADRFNDTSLPIRFSFTGHVDEADPSLDPLCKRSAASLKSHFQEARTVFSEALDNWERSGQNDPSRFENFLSKNGQNLYASSKRALMIFVAARLGTPYADSFFVEMSSKTIWQGGYEAGMDGLRGAEEGIEEDNGTRMGRVEGGRKRNRRDSLGISEVVDKHMEKLGNVVSHLSSGNVVSSSIVPIRNAALSKWNDINEMYKNVEEAFMALQRAKTISEGEDLVDIAETRYHNAKRSYREMFGSRS